MRTMNAHPKTMLCSSKTKQWCQETEQEITTAGNCVSLEKLKNS